MNSKPRPSTLEMLRMALESLCHREIAFLKDDHATAKLAHRNYLRAMGYVLDQSTEDCASAARAIKAIEI